jgi:hypothetical protein
MKKLEKFLAFYSIIVVTTLIVGATGLLPRPHNFIMLFLFLPVGIYFWLRLSAPNEVVASKWSVRLLLLIAILSGLGIFGYYLSINTYLLTQKTNENEKLTSQIDDLQNELTQINNELNVTSATPSSTVKKTVDDTSIADVLGEGNANTALTEPIGYIAPLSDALVDVYSEDSSTSTVVSTLKQNKNYPFYDKIGNYYLIGLDGGTKGYVKVNLVKQVIVSP